MKLSKYTRRDIAEIYKEANLDQSPDELIKLAERMRRVATEIERDVAWRRTNEMEEATP